MGIFANQIAILSESGRTRLQSDHKLMEFTLSETNRTNKWKKLVDPKRNDSPLWRFFIKPPNRIEIRPSFVEPSDNDECVPELVVEQDHLTTIILFKNEELYVRPLSSEAEKVSD